MAVQERRGVDRQLWDRVCGEYAEMPGLRLTPEQASRLWNVNPAVSRQILDALVDARILHRSGAHYVRIDSGRERA
jgi:hypothetical protein